MVWKILEIPSGQVWTYGGIAAMISKIQENNVGAGCRRCRPGIIRFQLSFCHRVVGSNGGLMDMRAV
ncbi:MAG: MGMT family protein [Alphaproteobacteria bacterium]